MKSHIWIGSFVLASLVAVPALALVPAEDLADLVTPAMTGPWALAECKDADLDGFADPDTETVHEFYDPITDTIVTVHLLCNFKPGDEPALDTDCTATGYSFTGWKWTTVENYRADTWNPSGISASTVLNRFQVSGDTWDGQVAANIYGSVSQGGNRANIPVYDGYNQFGWQNLASTTIASTWTWKSSSSVSALESDAAYNTDFGWSSAGASGKMDLQNIATHELGHTFGLGHSSSGSCLTMYPSGSLGETQKRSLGDGDILGIKARYP